MRLDGERESDNVEDRRGSGGGGFSGFPGGGGGIKIGGIGAVILVVGALLFGVDPSVVIGMLEGGASPEQQQSAPPAQRSVNRNDAQVSPAQRGQLTPAQRDASNEEPQRRFIAQILASTEDVWGEQFQAVGRRYTPPRLVLFSGATSSACGTAQSAMGPFYCPEDKNVYLDLAFFQELQNRLGAKGDFARAYVVAHEIGHHVQDEQGLLDKVAQARQQLDRTQQNQLSVMVELQADCYAGIWANHANQERHILEPGDVEEGLNAAAAVGDDRLQRAARGMVAPDSFTHGSSSQRVSWFRRGLQSGDMRQCNTFARQ